MGKKKKQRANFVREQYSQYHQIRRHVNTFSWQIPSIAILAIIFLVGLDKDRISFWIENPIYPAIGFLTISLFLIVLLVFHIRNIFFLRRFEKTLSEIEEKYGIKKLVYAHQLGRADTKWTERIKASTLLRYFLFILMTSSFIVSVYCWKEVFW